MIPEIDIWRAASLMLKRYGETALDESTRAPMSFSLSRTTTAPRCGAGLKWTPDLGPLVKV